MNSSHSSSKGAVLRVLLIGGLIGVSAILSACGQKGPLVLPADTAPVAPSSPAPESK